MEFPLNRPKMENSRLPQKTSAIISHEMGNIDCFGQGEAVSKEMGRKYMKEG